MSNLARAQKARGQCAWWWEYTLKPMRAAEMNTTEAHLRAKGIPVAPAAQEAHPGLQVGKEGKAAQKSAKRSVQKPSKEVGSVRTLSFICHGWIGMSNAYLFTAHAG